MSVKPSIKKKRLNLRTKVASSKAESTDSELRIQTDKETDLSEDNERQTSISVKRNLDDEHLDGTSDCNDKGAALKAIDKISSNMQCCPVCKYDFTSMYSDFSNLSSDSEINDHINKCLDSEKAQTKPSSPCEGCQICGKDLSKYNTVRRQQHINRCCDESEKTKPEVTSICCPICGKPFKTTKSRQAHMKKCAKLNNVSTHHLVELNRKENRNDPKLTNSSKQNPAQKPTAQNNNVAIQDTLNIARNDCRRKRKATLPSKNLDGDTQLALALSASMQSDSVDIGELGRRKTKKQKKEKSELPALLLRSDDEMKKVTEARAAAILCGWADDEEEIQCTPALAPSSLIKKYGQESSSDAQEPVPRQTEELDDDDDDDTTERCNSPVIEVRKTSRSYSKKCSCTNESESLGINASQGEQSKQYFTVDTRSRLWKLTSLRSDLITDNVFYVPNLLPKSTPRKKKQTRKTNSTTSEEQLQCVDTLEKHEDAPKDSLAKDSSICDDQLTESQQKNVDEWVELLINNENSDTPSSTDEEEQSEEFDKTWFPSSGFCVRKDMHEIGDKNKKEVNTLLNDLSRMVGNPLRSDVEIFAKDKKFCAHSFMLSARSSTLAEILQDREKCHKDDDSNVLIRLELLDIDVRAVQAVVTYIYTANFIPVAKNVLDDVEKLVQRWNLDCDLDKWDVIGDRTGNDVDDNDEHRNGSVEDLDVLLNSLWEGEEENVSGKNEDENALDDELGDLEIKIYTQASPQQNMLILDKEGRDENKVQTIKEITGNGLSTDKVQRNLGVHDEVVHKVVCIPETPSNLSPNCSPDKSNADKTLTEGDLTFVEQPMHCNLKIQASPSSDVSDNTSSVASFLQGHSSPLARDRDELGHLHSSPMSLSSTSFIEMLSSPERSPLPENLDDFVDSDDPKQGETFSIQNSPNTPMLNNSIVGPRQCTDEKRNIESCLNTCIPDFGSPEFRTTSSPIYSTKRKDYVATADEVSIRKTAQRKDDSKFVDQATAMEPNKLPGKIEGDSLLDIFSTSMTDSMTEQSLLCKQDIKVDTCPSIDISILSPKSVLTSPPLYSPSSKVKDLVVKKNEIELKLIDDEENMGRGARQSLVFTSENQDVNMDWTKENRHHRGEKCSGEKIKTSKDVSKTTKKQSSALTTNQVNSWPDKCSLPSKDEIDFDQSDRRSHDDITAVNDVDGVTKTQTEATPSVDAQINGQKDRSNDQFITPKCAHKTVTKQTCELADEENKDGENIYIDNDVDDEYIDCFDDGGFNCDIEEYFSYDAYSELDKMVSVDEEQGTSSLMNVDAGTSNHQSVSRNLKKGVRKQEKTSKGTKKRNNPVGGKAGKSHKEVAKKKAKADDIVHTEFKLRDPRTPMLDYSNMATPELKGELRQFGVRPLAKRKMVVKLKEIYNYTHKESESEPESEEDKDKKGSNVNEEEEPCSEDTSSQQRSTQDTESSDSEQNSCEEELSDNDDELLSQQSSSNLSNTLRSFLIQDHELYFKILKYMPISVADVLEAINGNGIKCSPAQLKNFFDEQCITYSEPRPARAQRRGRRAGKGKEKRQRFRGNLEDENVK